MKRALYKSALWWLWKKTEPIKFRLDYYRYKRRMPKIEEVIAAKERVKVVFFPINIGMWKNDYLFQMMMGDPHFEPYVISFFVPGDNIDFQRRNQEEMREYFTSKGYPYFDMYDFEKNEWFDIEAFHPDLVFYTQAVNVSYKRYNIQSLWYSSLFYYIPYCLLMENETKSDNTLLFNISKAVFAPSEYHKKAWSAFINKGRNIVVSGYPSFDYLINPQHKPFYAWKCGDNKKRVIWAPHHSIASYDLLSYSNFLTIADEMMELAKKYQDSIQFVFKPHPRLRPKLEQTKGWGIERTTSYYNLWATMSNTSYEDGAYYDLFLTSDAMIHDCSTFMAEYLLTGKPVMFNLRDESHLDLNQYAKECYKHHYIGKNINDIEAFLIDVVIGGNDIMKSKRQSYIDNNLKGKEIDSVAETIFNTIKGQLQ